jgi:S1-C subfamily serine protease
MSQTDGRFPWDAPQGEPWDERTGPDYVHPTQLARSLPEAEWTAPSDTAPPAAPAPRPQPTARRRRRAIVAAGMAAAVAAALASGLFAGHVLWPPELNLAAQPSTSSPVSPGPVGGSGGGSNSSGSGSTGGGSTGSGSTGSGSAGSGSGSTAQGSAATAAAIAKISPALVDINAAVGYNGEQAAGTGIVLTSDGYILTNHHVVAGSTKLSVTDIGNGQTYSASVVGYDASADVAVVKLTGASGLTTASLGDSGTVQVGDTVIGVGNAGGVGGTPSAAAGTVLALNQSITANDAGSGTSEQLHGLIAADANIQPGDSGGAMVNTAGDVIGVDTAGSTGSSATSGDGQQGANTVEGFAIPINTANAIARQIMAGQGSSTIHIGATAFLGVELASGGSQGAGGSSLGVPGVAVGGVITGSAADSAGLVAGDVITSVNGTSITTPDGLHAALMTQRPGDTISLGWTDLNGQSQSASVTLRAGPVG